MIGRETGRTNQHPTDHRPAGKIKNTRIRPGQALGVAGRAYPHDQFLAEDAADHISAHQVANPTKHLLGSQLWRGLQDGLDANG